MNTQEDEELEEDEEDQEAEPVGCPYCEVSGCDHLFASFDRSNAYCEAGYCRKHWHEFRESVERVFHPFLASPRRGEYFCVDPDVSDLWAEAHRTFKEGQTADQVSVDGYVVMRVVMQVLEEFGLDPRGGSNEGAGPGLSSVTSKFYDADPKALFARVLEDFEFRITSLGPEIGPELPLPVKTQKRAKRLPARKKSPARKSVPKSRATKAQPAAKRKR